MSEVMTLNDASVGVKEYFRSGNVAQLTESERDIVLAKLCERYDLDPLLRPFDLISFQGKAKFYLTASATNQLAAKKNLTRTVSNIELDEQRFIAKCAVSVSSPEGRSETSICYIGIGKFVPGTKEDPKPKKVLLDGDELANALLKLDTKAKRRATLSFFGLQDSGADYEDRPIETTNAPTFSQAAVQVESAVTSAQTTVADLKNDTVAAKNLLKVAKKEKAVKEEKPAKEEKPTEAKKPEVAQKLEEKLLVVDVEEITEVKEVKEEAKTEAKQVKVDETEAVIYERALHPSFLVDAVTIALGKDNWKADQVIVAKVKEIIPKLDKQIAVGNFKDGKVVLGEAFKQRVKELLGM